jgi:hypothetical protein
MSIEVPDVVAVGVPSVKPAAGAASHVNGPLPLLVSNVDAAPCDAGNV